MDTHTRTLWQRLGPSGVLGVLWAVSPALAGFYLLHRIGDVSEWMESLGDAGWAVYVGCFIVLAGVGVLPTYAQALLGGWVFGVVGGTSGALAGFVGASLVGYALARTVSRGRVEDVIQENEKARAIRDTLIGHGFWKTLGVVTLLRVPPNSPFAITNLVMASTGVSVVPFVLGTALGMLPRTAAAVAFAAIGAQTGAEDLYALASDKLPWWVIAVAIVVLLVVLAVIGSMANRALARLQPAEAGASDNGEDEADVESGVYRG